MKQKNSYIAEKRRKMYLENKMPEAAEYETVVKFIRWAFEQSEKSIDEWCNEQEDKFISTQQVYNILRGTSIAKYTTLYEIATRLGAEINISLPFPPGAKK